MQTQNGTMTSSNGSMLLDALIGAAAGAAGVWVMDRFDWFMWSREDPATRARTTAARPGGEPPAHVLTTRVEKLIGTHNPEEAEETATKIEGLDTGGLTGNRHFLAGKVVHYGIGVVPGALYGIVQDKLPFSGAARGALYGLTIFLTHDEALNAVTGLSGKPQDYPWQAHARGLVSHLVYGIVTDAVVSIVKDRVRSGRDGAQPSADHSSMVTTDERPDHPLSMAERSSAIAASPPSVH